MFFIKFFPETISFSRNHREKQLLPKKVLRKAHSRCTAVIWVNQEGHSTDMGVLDNRMKCVVSLRPDG